MALLDNLMEYQTHGQRVPSHMWEGIVRYIEDHQKSGDFLMAVLCNDLNGAFARADPMNFSNVGAIVGFFFNHAPESCWGSNERVEAWINKKKDG